MFPSHKCIKYATLQLLTLFTCFNTYNSFANINKKFHIATKPTFSTNGKPPLFEQLFDSTGDGHNNNFIEDSNESHQSNLNNPNDLEWRNIVMNEISNSRDKGTGIPVLSPESKKLLEDKIFQLRREANSDPGKHVYQPGRLWIIRPIKGAYCELMKKDQERIDELVRNTRKYYSEDKLEILDVKVDSNMPLCEIIFEGFINDIFRPFYARGTILQDEIVDRFRTQCSIIDKDVRLQVKYGGKHAPGLFPRWDTLGILEEIVEAMDIPPDWAAKFSVVNFKRLLHFCRDFDLQRIQFIRDTFNWPTREKVQRAFEQGIEDYRLVIQEEYDQLQFEDRNSESIPEWMPPMKDPPK